MSDFLKNLAPVVIASDHAGFDLKNSLVRSLTAISWVDLGTNNSTLSVDYPDFADLLAAQLTGNNFGVLICGSGQGICMRANKYSHIRAALCEDETMAGLAREHNDANVLCLGGRRISLETAKQIFRRFISTDFAGGRHTQRVNKLGLPATSSMTR